MVSPRWSKRATQKIADIRASNNWLEPGQTVLITDGNETRWWTFAGDKINRTLVLLLKENTNIEARSDSISIVIKCVLHLSDTDSLELFPCPEPNDDGNYEVKFFTRGISHLPDANQERIKKLQNGEQLFILKDIQNPYDRKALVLRSDDPISFCGYCPRFFKDDFNLLLEKCDDAAVKIKVEKVNIDAPMQMRVLCKLTACWPDHFRPCETDLYDPIPKSEIDFSCTY